MKRSILRKVCAGIYHKYQYFKLWQKKVNLKDTPKYINIGGGHAFVRKDWRNLEYESKRRFYMDYFINLMDNNKWDIKDNSFEMAYCSHVIEHLTDDAVKFLLKETYRVLTNNSTFRIVVPDYDLALQHYNQKDLEWFKLCYGKFAHLPEQEDDPLKHYLFKFYSKGENYDYNKSNIHINWFNKEKLISFLEDVGFTQIKVSAYKQSDEVEMCGDDFDGTIPMMSLYIECKKEEMENGR